MTEVRWKLVVQRCTDYFVDLYSKFFHKKDISERNAEPKQILLVTLGHLGDALIASFIFPLIRERYPKTALDVLTGEWCKPVLENNPYIRDLIFFEHFRANRSSISGWKKFMRHNNTARSALKTILLKRYDLSIEGRVHYPNGNLLCYRGKIKRRVGFGSGGYGSLLTDEVLFPSRSNFHLLDALLEELRIVGIDETLESIKPYFTTSIEVIQKLHPFAFCFQKPFVIIHPESGNIKRRLSREFWLQIVQSIIHATDYMIVICGTEKASSYLSDFLSENLSEGKERIIDTVGKLSLDEFFVLSRYAKAAFTVESLAVHLCAINCETISFYKKGSGTLFFPIPNKKSTMIHNHLPSKGAIVHPKIVNHFVNDIESKETTALVAEIIQSLVSRENKA